MNDRTIVPVPVKSVPVVATIVVVVVVVTITSSSSIAVARTITTNIPKQQQEQHRICKQHQQHQQRPLSLQHTSQSIQQRYYPIIQKKERQVPLHQHQWDECNRNCIFKKRYYHTSSIHNNNNNSNDSAWWNYLIALFKKSALHDDVTTSTTTTTMIPKHNDRKVNKDGCNNIGIVSDGTILHNTTTQVKVVTPIMIKDDETLDELYYRYSLINAHPYGPWQAIVKAVLIHYNNYHTITTTTSTTMTTTSSGSNTSDFTVLQEEEINQPVYKILDVGCGPRSEPGTTIANALLDVQSKQRNKNNNNNNNNNETIMNNHHHRTLVHCIDSCPIAIQTIPNIPSPTNLIRSVGNMDELSQHFIPNSMNVIVSCYGYGSSNNNDYDTIQSSLRQAYDILKPGGILILCTWQYSSLLSLSYDIITTLHHGCGDPAYIIRQENLYNMIENGTTVPPSITYNNNNRNGSYNNKNKNIHHHHHCFSGERPTIQYSGTNEWEELLHKAGFNNNNSNNNHIHTNNNIDTFKSNTQSTIHTYPINMGNTIQEQLNFGTLLIPHDLQNQYFNRNTNTTTNDNTYNILNRSSCFDSEPKLAYHRQQPYKNNIEEAFWMNISDYIVTTTTTTTSNNVSNNSHDDHNIGSMWLPKNVFKLTISTK